MDLKQKFREKFEESKCFVRFVAHHFIEDDCTYRASALTFSTLLAIIPLLTVGFAIFSSFPAFEHLIDPVQNFIFKNFVPTTSELIQDYLKTLPAQVSKLSIMGVLFLFAIALLVMFTIESAMNRIWRVGASRHRITAFLFYWAIVSLAPFLLGLSIAISSYLLSIPFLANYKIPVLLHGLPFFFSLAGFTFLYVVVPNCRVRFLHGLYGGFIAALLFESAKYGFAYYLTHYNTYELLYGTFATIPIFFVWIYWVWIITLLGAEISYAFSTHHQRRPGRPLDGFSHALLCLYQLWLAQQEGKELTTEELINASQQAYAVDIGYILRQLIDLRLIKTTSDNHYILSRDLNHLTLYELTQLLPYRLPNVMDLAHHQDMIVLGWQEQIRKADEELKGTLKISLGELFRGK